MGSAISIAKVIMSQSQSLAKTGSIKNVLIRGKGLEYHTGTHALGLLSHTLQALVISLPSLLLLIQVSHIAHFFLFFILID